MIDVVEQFVTGTIKAIERFEEIHSLGAGNWNSSKIPMGRIIYIVTT
jgi:hypothetical protein